MELLEKKLKLTNSELNIIRESALVNIKELALGPRMDHNAFLAYCWSKATLDFLSGKDIVDIELVK